MMVPDLNRDKRMAIVLWIAAAAMVVVVLARLFA